jgi:hypothetical protein
MKHRYRPDSDRIRRSDHRKTSAYSIVPHRTHFGAMCGLDRLLLARSPDRREGSALIGGRYSLAQRVRIREHVREKLPGAHRTEPGWDYPYESRLIEADIRARLGRPA